MNKNNNDDNGNDDDGDDDENENKNNTVVAPASLEFAVDPSELAGATDAIVLVSVRDVADPDPAPTPDCDSRFDNAASRRKGSPARAGVASRRPRISSVDSFATLRTIRVVAVTCPGDADDATNATDWTRPLRVRV